MTERLYYTDPGLVEFEGRIVESRQEGEKHVTILDRSAFYPTSGGQQFDTGRLGSVPIVEVVESEKGDVLHISTEKVGEVGSTVQGAIDRERRQRHRRQHTAQHILSAVFARLFDLATESVHLGEEYGAIEFDTKSLSHGQLEQAEKRANEIVLDNHPVNILFVDSEDVVDLPLRRPPKRSGELRIIHIEECDYVACGGTHVGATAEVGPIKITGTEKIRGRTMVKFLSGRLALEDYATRFVVSDHLSRTLTCGVEDLPERFEKMSAEIRDLKQQIRSTQKQLLPVMASELVQKAQTQGNIRYVADAVSDLDASAAIQLAELVADEIDGLAVLYVEGRLVLGVSQSSGLHAGDMARSLSQASELKGGGNQVQAQLGGAAPERLNQYVEGLLSAI